MISKQDFVQKAQDRIKESRNAFAQEWYKEARDSYDFISGRQWQDEDESYLESQNRPIVTFNYSEKMIDAICGAEVSNRQEVRYIPREVTDSGKVEIWTEAARWTRDQCNAEDEETDAFRDCLICGIGATRTAMSYEENSDGMIVIDRRDPMYLFYDPAARKPGLVDRRYDGERGWMDETEAKLRWPKADLFGSMGDADTGNTGVITQGHRYEGEDADSTYDTHKGQVEVILYECMEKEAFFKVADGNQMLEMDAAEFGPLRAQLDKFGVKYVRLLRKVYYRGFFTGDGSLLEWGKSPTQKGFTLNFMTGKRDRNKNLWYGITRVMKDPQRWANKWLAQIMHIINSNAKGGLLAEVDAFVDPRKAEDEWAEPDSITLLKQGALSGGKVQQKQMSPYPTGLDRLMDFALNSLPMVTGINLEALGLANRDQANVLEQSRKQAAYGLLAPIFDSLRRYRKMQGKVMLDFITQFIADGRLIRIVGPDQAQLVPLTREEGSTTYDVVIDQSPNAPDVKQRTWDQVKEILPIMIKEGYPIPPELMSFSPLPTTLVTKWQEYIKQMGNVNPKQVQQMKEELDKLMQENQALKQDQSVKMGELDMKRQQAAAQQTLDAQKAAAELSLEEFKLKMELQLEEMKLKGEMAINEQKLNHDAKMSDQKIKGDLKIKAASAGINSTKEGDLALKLDASEISDALTGIAKSNEVLAGMMKEINEANAKSLAAIQEAMNRPRVVVRDKDGRPTGVKPVDKLKE